MAVAVAPVKSTSQLTLVAPCDHTAAFLTQTLKLDDQTTIKFEIW